MFENVLVGTDGSPSALLAARLAGVVCPAGAVVKLVHVTAGLRDLAALGVDAAAGAIGGTMGDLRDRVELAESEEGAKLLTETRSVLGDGLRVETYERRGRPYVVLLRELEQKDVDSAIVGTRGRGSIARAFFGSVADAIMRGATKPALVARRAGVRGIVVGFDGSQASRRAARAAATLAARTGSSITLLHVADVPIVPVEKASTTAALRSVVQPLLAEARDDIRAIAPTAEVTERFVDGDAAPGILDEAAKLGADLIALGRTGWTHDARLPLGSVAQRVVTHSDASVLIVP